MFDDEINEIIKFLIDEGAIEIADIDEASGEILYKMNQKMKDIMPELYEEHMNAIGLEIMSLWQKGFIELDILEDDTLIYLCEKAGDVESLNELSDEEAWALAEIVRAIGKEEV